MTKLNRRRFITISAAAAGLVGAGGLPTLAGTNETVPLYRWQGRVMGAEATLLLAHEDEAKAEALVREALAEINRLEDVFSIYRQDSALSRLNKAGEIGNAPLDLVRLVAESRQFNTQTNGAFDITVQPLWQAAVDGRDMTEALKLVGMDGLRLDGTRIVFDKPGMGITMNGIAQGYITDRVADLLRRRGLDNVLVNLGEQRALGQHPSGRDWQAGIADPANPGRYLKKLALSDTALATSGGYGTTLGEKNHLFDPRTGASAKRYASVSVESNRATVADALSTAFCHMSLDDAGLCLKRLGRGRAHFLMHDGEIVTL